jgi:hypothetical protein
LTETPASVDSFSMAAAIRARWHQLLKLSCVSAENSRDSDLVVAGRVRQHDVGGAPAARFARQRDEGRGILRLVQFHHRQPQQQRGSFLVAAIVEQSENRLVQQRRHPHHEFRIQAVAARFALQPVEFEIQRPHLDIGQHVDRMFRQGRHPDRAVRRHQPAAFRRRHLHRPLRRINKLRLAVHVGVDPKTLPVAVGDHVDAVAGRGQASDNGGNWLFGDIHWRHPVRTTPYNLFRKIAGFGNRP